MINVLLITFAMSLIYMSIANRMSSYILILAFQGLLLFGISFIELSEINTLNLVFVLLETIIVKTIAIPLFLKYVIKRNKITREVEPYLPNFVSLVIVTVIIISTFLVTYSIDDKYLNKIYFAMALSVLLSGLYIIISRKKLITHVVGFLVIENGVFILSMAVGNKMPMLINTSILLDLFVSVLVLGIFVNKIGDVFKEPDVNQLSQLRD
jgi:hydrogenase-4 component E